MITIIKFKILEKKGLILIPQIPVMQKVIFYLLHSYFKKKKR